MTEKKPKTDLIKALHKDYQRASIIFVIGYTILTFFVTNSLYGVVYGFGLICIIYSLSYLRIVPFLGVMFYGIAYNVIFPIVSEYGMSSSMMFSKIPYLFGLFSAYVNCILITIGFIFAIINEWLGD